MRLPFLASGYTGKGHLIWILFQGGGFGVLVGRRYILCRWSSVIRFGFVGLLLNPVQACIFPRSKSDVVAKSNIEVEKVFHEGFL